MSSVKDQLQELNKELSNLSINQLENYKEVTETTAMYVQGTHTYWMELVFKYKESWNALALLATKNLKRNKCLIKINEYLFVEGMVEKSADKVLVNIGGKYYANMTIREAKDFFRRRGGYGMQLGKYYEQLYDRKMMVFNAVNETLWEKLNAKVIQIEEENANIFRR